MATLAESAFLTGFLGDAVLQLLVKAGMGGPGGWGLKQYFEQHGVGESMCIAGGMLTLFALFYDKVLHAPLKWYYLALYGVILDLLFRLARLFPSLDGYYRHLNYFWSAVWGAIPMVTVLLVYQALKKTQHPLRHRTARPL